MSWTKRGKEEKGSKDSYDSGCADSGIVSGSFLLSGCMSGDLSPPAGRKNVTSQRLDSGVDISDRLSSLDIDDGLNDLGTATANNPRIRPLATDELTLQHNFKQDEEGDSLLHIAVISNRYKDLVTLVQMVPDPKYLDIRNDMRQTALHLAVLTGQEKMVKLLVAAGASTDSVDHDGNTPLHLATAAGQLELVKELTLPPSDLTLRRIGLRYQPPTRSHPALELNMFNYQGLACVHLALLGGNMALLKHLVWYGANINAGELKGGLTALHMAATGGDVGLVKTLVRELGANPCPLTYSGESPYLLARSALAQSNMTSALLDLGSSCLGDSDSEDEDHWAAHYYSEDDEDDLQMVDRSLSMRDFPVSVAVSY